MSTKVVLTFITLLLMLTIISSVLAADKKLEFALPHLSSLVTPNQCRCKAIVSSHLFANTIEGKNISARLKRGVDEISIEIEGNTLYFLSDASFNLGEAKSAKFQVIYNTEEEVLAICHQQTAGYTVDIFTLHKKTGLALWTKTRSFDLLSGGTPSGQSFYLICK
jgi:hypothetical protein